MAPQMVQFTGLLVVLAGYWQKCPLEWSVP
jgi:hypothetical protein